MIYLDYHAATPLSDVAQAAMERSRESAYANPSSVHSAGRASRALVEGAREQVAGAIKARPADVIWTSGGTEACNLAIEGLECSRVVISDVEHSAVAKAAEALGVPCEVIPVAALRSGDVSEFLDEQTLLATQWVNHETGSIWPVEKLASACRAQGASFFLDGTQALGRLEIDVDEIGADAIAFASHKVGGPSGSGGLWVRRDRPLASSMHGGGQERGRRAGSPGVEAIVGFGAACENLAERIETLASLGWRNDLEACLVELGAVVNGAEGPRVMSATNVSVSGWDSAVLVAALDMEGLCASAGAACSSGTPAPSAVIEALYPDEPWRAGSALRLSLGPENLRAEDIAKASVILRRVLPRGR